MKKHWRLSRVRSNLPHSEKTVQDLSRCGAELRVFRYNYVP
jgi:hypothetical protein